MYVVTNIPDKRVERAISGLSKANSNHNGTVISKVSEILRRMLNHSEFNELLKNEGIHLATLKQATDYLIPELNLKNFGYSKYADFIQHVCLVSGVASLYTKPPSEIRLNRNNLTILGYTQMGLTKPPTHLKQLVNTNPPATQKSVLNKKHSTTNDVIIIRKANTARPSRSQCRFCDSIAMPGSDVCYSCSN